MKLLICGGRYLDEIRAEKVIADWIVGYENGTGTFVTEIISGGARGADTAAYWYTRHHGIYMNEFPADWNKYGKAARMIRNKKMLTEGQPDAILALSGGEGTKNMVDIGRKAGVPVFELECK